MHRFVIELRKLILSIFLSKNLDARFFSKKSLSVYNANFLQKKPRKFPFIDFAQNIKPHLGPILGTFPKIICVNFTSMLLQFHAKIRKGRYIYFW